jgi:hypothetical protein
MSTLAPTLFYGVEAWYHPKLHAATRILQTGQDDFCRQMAGTFHTTPHELNSRLAHIPPVKFRLTQLADRAVVRLQKLPQWSLLRRPETVRKTSLMPRHAHVSPVIYGANEMTLTTYVPPPPMHDPCWEHPHCHFATSPCRLTTTTFFHMQTLTVLHSRHRRDDLYMGFFRLSDGRGGVTSDYCLGRSPREVCLGALIQGLR